MTGRRLPEDGMVGDLLRGSTLWGGVFVRIAENVKATTGGSTRTGGKAAD